MLTFRLCGKVGDQPIEALPIPELIINCAVMLKNTQHFYYWLL